MTLADVVEAGRHGVRRVVRVEHHAAHFHRRQHAAHGARFEHAGESGDDAGAQVGLESSRWLATALGDGGQPDVRLIVGCLRQFLEQRLAWGTALTLGHHAIQPGRLLFFPPGFLRIANAACLLY